MGESRGLSLIEKTLSFGAGVGIVIFATILGIIMVSIATIPVYDQYIKPLNLAAIGMGTGYFLVSARDNNERAITWGGLGFFVAIFIESLYYTHNIVVQKLPYPLITFSALLVIILLYESPIISNNYTLETWMNLFSGKVTTGFLIATTIFEYMFSFFVDILDTIKLPEDLSFGTWDLIVMLAFILAFFYLSDKFGGILLRVYKSYKGKTA